jgi:hypothetical protein
MPGRGGSAAKRRAKGRASRSRTENARTVSEEVTVLVNTLRELAAIRSTAEDAPGQRVTKITKSLDRVLAKRMKGAGRGKERAVTPPRKGEPKLELEGPGLGEASQASIDALFRDKN